MKMIWSACFTLLLFVLAGCGAEQFGTIPQSQKSTADAIRTFEQLSCSSYTLIKPKVDILYVVDNSDSTVYLGDDIKNALKNTVDSISKDFDFRVIGTPLIATPNGNEDYQVLTNSQDSLSAQSAGHKIISSSEFNFFSNRVNGAEKGLDRVQSFVNAHISDGLFRKGAYLLIVVISNGRDTDIEVDAGFGNGETTQNASVYNDRKSKFIPASSSSTTGSAGSGHTAQAAPTPSGTSLKEKLSSQQLRLFSVTARTSNCNGNSGWLSSMKSYVQMSKDLYLNSGATDQGSAVWPDNYDLCTGGLSNVFTAVNNSIKQVVVPHTYKYWPITFANDNETVSLADTKVFKVSGNSAPVEILSNNGANWSLFTNPNYPSQPLNTRELPTAGEPVSGKYFVEFKSGSKITYPDCVMVKSVSRTEYFGWIVLPQEPKPETIIVRINGKTPSFTYKGYQGDTNLKMPYPHAGDELPAVMKSGFMIQLNGPDNYYKSGDNVEVYYLPAGI